MSLFFYISKENMNYTIIKRDKAKRHENDFYATPYGLTRCLLHKVKLNGSILEPACGDGAITKVLAEYGYTYAAYDVEKNFLTEIRHFDTIITNPPYSIHQEFINKAKDVSDEFFFLLPLAFLHGKNRYEKVWTDNYKLKTVYVFTRYPFFGEPLREDGSCRCGMTVYAWYHWSKSHTGSPTIEWLDNGKYIR